MVLLSLVVCAPLFLRFVDFDMPLNTRFVNTAIPCQNPSDFIVENTVEGTQTCGTAAAILVPSSAAECSVKPDGVTSKADMLKLLYSKCCTPASKPNPICGLQLSLPCNRASDFDGKAEVDAGQTCQDVASFFLPSSASECNTKVPNTSMTKAEMVKYLYGKCCKADSKPNPICGFQVTSPCDRASDFIPSNTLDGQHTCKDMTDHFSLTLPSWPAECDERLVDNPMTKADMLRHMYAACCKPESKPNPICGLESSAATPCENKAKGEFLGTATFSDDGTTCFMAQQLGFFEINKPSECDTPKPEFGGSTSAEMLAHAATVCCQSRKVDQMVCRVGKCVASVALCLALHNDFEDAAKKITNPKAMEMSDEGNFEGDCAAAILNRVEGALCCTTGMQLLGKCVEREVGDYKACEDSWNAAFEPTFFDKAEAIAKAFQTGGYCAPQSTSASVCPKCGTIKKSGKLSCCAPGGSWVKQCGNPGNSKFEHTWSEGIDACRTQDGPPPPVTKPVGSRCYKCGLIKKSNKNKLSCCAPGGSWFKKCGDPGDSKFEHTWTEGNEACKNRFMPPEPASSHCPKCGAIKKSGKRSCCAPGGAWFKKCGNPGDSKFEHTWTEGNEACQNKVMRPVGSACSKCGTIKKSGKPSCCAPGGSWLKQCGNPGDSKFEHTWSEGVLACKNGDRPPVPNPTRFVCPYCRTIKKSGKRSCCAPGGAWSKKCGNPGNSKFEHTWSEGIDACRKKQPRPRSVQHMNDGQRQPVIESDPVSAVSVEHNGATSTRRGIGAFVTPLIAIMHLQM